LKSVKPRPKNSLPNDRWTRSFLWGTPTGSKLWRWKYRFEGKQKQMSYGAYTDVPLAAARENDEPRVNPNGGAIAIGHPLGASGARLVMTAINELEATSERYALCTMCIGVGQGIALILSRI
jgi:Thiolase, C-terminal domain